jgi:hypothetical protein
MLSTSAEVTSTAQTVRTQVTDLLNMRMPYVFGDDVTSEIIKLLDTTNVFK